MQNHEYEEAIRRELRAHQLAAIRLQRLEAERQAVVDIAMQRSLGLVHQPTSSMYYVDSSVNRPVLEDSWWAAPVRPRSYEPWQQPPLPQHHGDPFLMRRNVVATQPAAPLRTWASMEDESRQRKSSFGVPYSDRTEISSRASSSGQPSVPVPLTTMPSPSIVAQHAHSNLKLPSKNKTTIAHAQTNGDVMDPKDKPKKRGRPLGSKNAVLITTKPSPVPMRQSWTDLALGITRGTPAYNAHQRAVHRASGQPLPEELTALDFARKVYSVRVKKVPLPDQSPLRRLLERTSNVSESQESLVINTDESDELVQQTIASMSANGDNKKRGHKSLDGASDMHRDLKLQKVEKKKGKKSNGSTAITTSSMVRNDHYREQQSTTEALDGVTPFPHALHRLYQIIQRQEMEDCMTDMKNSHEWCVEDIKSKIQGFEDEIAELDKMENQIIKESKQLNATNLAVLEEAHRLSGVMPPKGC